MFFVPNSGNPYLVAGGTVDGLLALATAELRPLPEDVHQAGSPDRGKPGASLIAQELADDWRGTVMYETTRRRWMNWGFNQEGIGHWWECTEEQILARIARDLTERLPGGFSWNFLQGMERLLRLHLQRALKPPSRDWLPFRNGALHLPTKTLEEHTPERGFTWCLPYDYNPLASCEPILTWMRQALDKTRDGVKDRVRLLLANLKAILTGRTDLQRFLEAIGPGGGGKGTYAKLAMGFVGIENVHVTTLPRLETNRFETAKILGKRLVLITDADTYAGSVAVLKALVGADPLTGERKYATESRPFIPEAMVIVATNEAVQSADYTSGLQRRRLSLLFPYTPDVPRRLLDFVDGVAVGEFAPYLPGLVNAVLAIPDEDVTVSLRYTLRAIPSLREAWRRAMADTNPLAAWADEALSLEAEAKTYTGRVERDDRTGRLTHTDEWMYASYRAYCEGAGVQRPVSMQRFKRLLMDFCKRQLKLNGVDEGRDTAGSFVTGLRPRLALTDTSERLMDQTLFYDGFDGSDELFKKYIGKDRHIHTTRR